MAREDVVEGLVGEVRDANSRASRPCGHAGHAVDLVDRQGIGADPTTEPVVAVLENAHRRGVTVRVQIDHLGSVGHPGYRQMVHRLEPAGIPCRRMPPVRPWLRGLMVRVRGPAVGHLDVLFATDAYCEHDDVVAGRTPVPGPETSPGEVACQVLPSGPELAQESNLQLFNYQRPVRRRSMEDERVQPLLRARGLHGQLLAHRRGPGEWRCTCTRARPPTTC
ncbi:phosphatidylserine/phosphatidylglycerophosphate/cardiolipin synthase family protein [Kocuria sp. M1R5S2]|uniref:phospholipase D-like domain-containing protein n=1 Tax=Kocuria rhizosphaerae TaxID=3376285 RepID=UPI00379AB4D2